MQSDRTVTRFQTQKTGALLGYLALHRHQAHSREMLAELLWPGGDPVAVRNRLNQAVSSLRRQLEPANVIYGSVLLTDQRSIRLQPDAVVTDVEEFERCVLKAESIEADLERKSLLRKSVDLYGGEFLSGYYADWVGMEQLRFADLYTNALYDLLDVCRDMGDIEQAIRAANLLLKADPADEGTHCDLMRLYIDAGRPSAARRQYEELCRILATEETTPSDEAFQLNQEATSKRATSGKSSDAPSPVNIPSEPTIEESPPPLPAPTNRFLGRESDVAKLQSMLSVDSNRMISIVGLGGCGKTRLALQIAYESSEQYARQVFFIPLADIKDINQIEDLIAKVMGVRGTENVARRLRANERTLLILDSFEHLADQGAELIQRLVESVPGLKLLVTSRQPLRIDAERVYQLAPLPVPASSDAVEDLIRNPSVALLVDRAQAVLPDFQLTQRNADVIRQVCTRLEGIPLAIELVASWAKTVAPGQMAALLSDRFALLESRRRDITARHRTMRAVIDSSLALLEPEYQSLFNRLSVFQGGWTLEAAAFVCQTPQVLAAMNGLSEHSLVQIENPDVETIRFRMMDTLRDYAAEHIPNADKAECENLHAAFYSQLAAQGADQLPRSDQGLWRERLEAEAANFAAAFHWYLSHDLIQSALELANALTTFWEFKGRTREGRRWMEAALSQIRPDTVVDEKERAKAMSNLARLAWMHGDFAESSRWHEAALEAWLRIGDQAGIIAAQFNIQLEAHRNRNYERSIALLKDNLARAEDINDKVSQTRCWLALGNTLIELRQLTEARVHYEQSLKLAREIDNKYRIATALSNLGNLDTLLEQYDVARHNLQEAVSLFEVIGAGPSCTDAFLHFAKMERRVGDIQASLHWLDRAWQNAPEENYHVQTLFLEQAYSAALLEKYMLAATFLGFIDRQRQDVGALNFDIESNDYDQLLEKLRSNLAETTLNNCWQIGRDMQLSQAAGRLLHPTLEPVESTS